MQVQVYNRIKKKSSPESQASLLAIGKQSRVDQGRTYKLHRTMSIKQHDLTSRNQEQDFGLTRRLLTFEICIRLKI